MNNIQNSHDNTKERIVLIGFIDGFKLFKIKR